MSEKRTYGSNRRSIIRTLGGISVGSSIGIWGGSANASEFNTISIPNDIPTEPEKEVYRESDTTTYSGYRHVSNSMDWFRSFDTGDGTWIHDFSVACSGASEHPTYDNVLTNGIYGWGYRIQGPEGSIHANVEEDMHGTYPEGVSGNIPEWTGIVMEGALSAISIPASVLKTADELQNHMEPADGFNFDVSDGFGWKETRGWSDGFDSREKETHTHHRVLYESESTVPEIKNRASILYKYVPFVEKEWLHLNVETLGSWYPDNEHAHPEDMSDDQREALGIKKIEQKPSGSETNQFSKYEDILGKEINPNYVITKCPWSRETNTTVTKEKIEYPTS